jgi:2-polyprenyl-6-methoxyphenol hydroxylase-like FAD-dependent oxidoreductase
MKVDMNLNKKKIAIVGGGPGGLTLATLLQQAGLNVRVYERDLNEHARVQGSTLDMHEDSGLKAIISAGLFDAFKKNFLARADRTKIMDQHAGVLFSDHETSLAEDFSNPAFRPEISRGALRKILLDSLQPGTVVWNSHFLAMVREGEGWTLSFKNSDPVYADIVVASDGANSKLRSYITDSKAFYSGITMLEGNIYDAATKAPAIYELLSGGKIMAFGNGRNILMGQKGNEEIGFYASFHAEENWSAACGVDFSDRAAVLAWFRREYAGWDPVWNELFEAAVLPFVPRPIYCMPFEQSWEALPNLTLIGDAAHVMPPFAGEGANMAMLDALELSECLQRYSNAQEAIGVYESQMRERAAIAAKDSQLNGKKMHASDSLEQMLQFFSGAVTADPLPSTIL